MLAAAPSVGLGPDGQWDLTITCPRCRAAPSSSRPRPSALRPPRLPSRPWARPSGAMPRAGPQCLPLRRASVYRGTQDEALVGPGAWLRKRPLLSTLWAEAAAVRPAPPRPGRHSRGLPLPPRPAGPTSLPALSAGLQGYFGCAPARANPLRRPCCPVPSTGARPAAKGDDLRGSAQPPPRRPGHWGDAMDAGPGPSRRGRGAEAGRGPVTTGKVRRLGCLASRVHRGGPKRAASPTQPPAPGRGRRCPSGPVVRGRGVRGRLQALSHLGRKEDTRGALLGSGS